MIHILLLIINLISLFPKMESNQDTIKAMTFNIRYGTADDGENSWEFRKDLVFNVIMESQCDFVGMQEAMIFQVDEILENCTAYQYIGVTRETDPTKGEASPILYNSSRWKLIDGKTMWLSETPDIPGSKSWKSSLPRIFTWGKFEHKVSGRQILIVNTHYDHRSADARYHSSGVIVEHIKRMKNDLPSILLGDLNAGEDQAPITYLTDNEVLPLNDAYRTINMKPEEKDMTFYGWKAHIPGTGKRLDYIFYTGDIKVLYSKVINYNSDGRYPSDHMPVIAEFK